VNGLDSINLSQDHFRLIGMGSTAGDVLVELIRRRCVEHGHLFKVTLHYRSPRRYTTYMGTLVQPPGVFPIYYSTQYSSLGQRIDAKILQESKNKYPEIEKIGAAYRANELKRQVKGGSEGFTAIMNVLVYHPVVALKVGFMQLVDKSELSNDSAALVDCTNGISYNIQTDDEKPTARVDFAPNMLALTPGFRTALTSNWRLPGPFFGQWSTAQGAMGQVLFPHVMMDVEKPVFPCIAQCNSVFYFARFHLISGWFMVFQYLPTSVQLLGALLYEIIMRVGALTGFTYVFFFSHAYAHTPHQSPEQNFGVIEARWDWYSKQVSYTGDDARFPCPFSELPGVPKCYNFSWMIESQSALKARMTISLLCVCAYVGATTFSASTAAAYYYLVSAVSSLESYVS